MLNFINVLLGLEKFVNKIEKVVYETVHLLLII